jgi:hypothetical protein
VAESDIELTPLQQSDYPHVNFWFKRDWLNSGKRNLPVGDGTLSLRGKARVGQALNVMMRYVENENGKVVDGSRAAAMRAIARSIWVDFAQKHSEPLTWGQADANLKGTYFHKMNSLFSELRLCDAHWKADQIATDNYPSWHANWQAKGPEPQDADEGPVDAKRPRQDSMMAMTVAKRMRSGIFVSRHLPTQAFLTPLFISLNCQSIPMLSIICQLSTCRMASLLHPSPCLIRNQVLIA